jgi:hypothetical protein
MINRIGFHTFIIRIRQSFHARLRPTPGRLRHFSLPDYKDSITLLDDALIEHRIRDFNEAGDVSANHQITRVPVFGGGFPRVFVDR